MRAAGTRETCCPSFFCIMTKSFSATSSTMMLRPTIPRRFCVAIPKSNCGQCPHIAIPESRISSALALQETCWKESRGIADWVIVTDIDEHLYHPDMYNYLAQCRAQGVTIIPGLGYQMLSEQFPEHKTLLCQSLTRGACYPYYSKLNIFSPNEIDAVNYTPGRHTAAPTGHVVCQRGTNYYCFTTIIWASSVFENAMLNFSTRQRKNDIAMGWGPQYSWSSQQLREAWNLVASRLVDISRPDLRPWETHEGPRWWRDRRRGGRAFRWPSKAWRVFSRLSVRICGRF